MSHHNKEHAISHHIIPPRVYYGIFAVLMLLLGLTVVVAFIDIGPLSIVAALSIAVIKALLIALYFMHIRYSSRLTQVFAMAALLWLTILISLTVSDYLARGEEWHQMPIDREGQVQLREYGA